MSLTTIRTRYDNTKCRVCSEPIPYNGLCRYSRQIKGVACMACEPEAPRVTTPANGAPTSAMDPQLQAALADGQALRKRIGELTADVERMNAAARDAALTIQTLRDELATSKEVRLAQAAHILALMPINEEQAIDDGPELINVMAPGGVERWLERDLADIAAEKAMKERQAIPVITEDDCPI